MATKEVKFTEDEMKQINDLQQGYLGVQNAFGQVNVNKLRLEQQLQALDTTETNLKSSFVEIQQKEREFVDGINKKYGDGNLDLTTGVFIPKPVEKTTEKTDKTL